MDRSKFPEREECPNRLRIFRVVIATLEIGTGWIRFPSARQRSRNYVSRRCNNSRIETADRDFVSGLRDRMLRLAVKLRVDVLQEVIGCFRRLDIRAMIDELL